tara:strand:+ start:1717 stop:2238 length:522 start_codon:yes stop_codon:yes gene_type:complete
MQQTRLQVLLILTGICFCAIVWSGLAGRPDPIDSGQIAPTFTLPNLTGTKVNFEQALGKVSLVMFWASWCHPCMKEMPEVQATFKKYKQQGFQVLAVNFGESNTTAKKIVNRFELTFPVLMDRRGDVAADYRVLGLPLSFFVDSKGVVRERVFGKIMTKEDLDKRVKHYLSEV